ncbi:nucleoside recognition protein [Natrarchaeobaculum aegyptiacum]|uniref:Nucleoside recognition protein n=1 Tax=Natrarchaeobaculum aegyptiacum TaxID=745377 RepID=A0A2Z2HYF6_9EURY|nr:nucleoside recognition protein [Natrarchaeobaculum aegyptiacum]ARS88558.1 nucleoside recognition protein [Natrarchaeobaculum aegyptiacum]
MESIGSILAFEVLPRVLTITALIGVGVALANVAVEYGLVEIVARVGRYLTEPANLPDEVGTAVLTNAVSVTAGYGMLAEFRESGLLDDRATLIAVVLNTFFGFVQHIFTFYGPVVIPILGLHAGFLYVGSRAGISLAISVVGLLAGALLLRGYRYDSTALEPDVPDDETEERTARDKLGRAGRKTLTRLRSIVPRLAAVYAVVIVGLEYHDLEALTAGVEPIASMLGLPGAAIGVIVVATVDPTSGVILLGPLIGEEFTPTEAVVTLLLGSLFSLTVTVAKRSIPFQFGIWGAEFGAKVVAVNTGLRALMTIAAIAVVLAL